MERDENILQSVIKFLLSHGYPQESIAVEYPIGKYRIDLAILDIETKEPIALFEFKAKRTPSAERFGREQLKPFLKAASNSSIPTYLVFEKESPPFYEIEKILVNDQETMMPLFAEKPLDYDILKQSGRNILITRKKAENKDAFDVFKIACWICVVLVFVVFVLDALGRIELSEKQLVLLSGAIALAIIPFASKLKILGVEFERMKEGNK